MLVKLSARDLRPVAATSSAPFVGRISESADLASSARSREILLVRGEAGRLPAGFRAYLVYKATPELQQTDVYVLGASLQYLAHGDVVRIDPQHRRCSALYRRKSSSNTLLVTERCDNYCLMCSQPPKERDDRWLVDELLADVLPLVDRETREVGITGGEPALLGDRLVELVDATKRELPNTAVHILSNGRKFKDADFARALGTVRHPDLMVGIPVYSAVPEDHDFVVQARGAFDDTIRGIINLKRAGVRVEIRMVIHRHTFAGLAEFARFVARNLLFVDHVALMGLEQVGFAKANIDDLWVDPIDYQSELLEAVCILRHAGMMCSIYNHQLCVLPASLHEVARRAISDWKNAYVGECERCSQKPACGGFFVSSTARRSRGISAFS